MPYTYRNTNTGDVYVLAERNPRLDNLHNWQLVAETEATAEDQEWLARQLAEKRAIEEAAAERFRIAQEKAAAKLAVEAAMAAGLAEVHASSPKAPAAAPAAPAPVLANKDKATVSREELEARAAHDLAHPPRSTVLQRARHDQRTGVVQIGDNPEEHPRGREALEAQAAYDTENPLGPVLDRVEAPKRNAAQAAWVEYAVAQGAERADVEGLSRDELIEQFGK